MAARKHTSPASADHSARSFAWPRTSFPGGMSTQDGWRLATRRAESYVAEVVHCSVPMTREYGCMHRDALLALVRRGLSSSNTVELEATREVLRFAQEAMVRFHDHALLAGARARYLTDAADGAGWE